MAETKFTEKEVKELRTKTGCGMLDCRLALSEAQGDMIKAVDILKKRAEKRLHA